VYFRRSLKLAFRLNITLNHKHLFIKKYFLHLLTNNLHFVDDLKQHQNDFKFNINPVRNKKVGIILEVVKLASSCKLLTICQGSSKSQPKMHQLLYLCSDFLMLKDEA